ncbi:MAG TPA: 30S ribosomal protein S8 [Candidatus Omnitrophota bacterium]|jgi:small subunit ribosomal protein S8|nr:30S ribosomal protein S8 [Candidatus Omnitrophota bacterium]
MSRYDFIGDFLTSVRNASKARKDKLTAPASALTVRIAELLKDEGFIENVKPYNDGNKNFVRIHLKYLPGGKKPAIQGLKRISTPGLRRYVGYEEIPKILGGFGAVILSTPKGVMTGKQAREAKVGGEILCTVW